MNTSRRSAQVIVFVAATLVIGLIAFSVSKTRSVLRTNNAPKAGPQLILWAWERPTDLRFIDKNRVGVAFLAKSIFLKGDDVQARPRLQPLELAPGTEVIAVTRIEADGATLSTAQRQGVVQAIADTASLPNVSEIQIDFDATKSERDFYRQLI